MRITNSIVFMRIVRPVSLFALGSLFFFGALLFYVSAASAQTACDTYSSGSTPPAGYGAAWNQLTSARELLLSTKCRTDAADYKVGTGNQNHYIYSTGYYYTTSWVPFAFQGTYVENSSAWLKGTATYTRNSVPPGAHHWVAYLCQWNGIAWYCGCANQQCQQQNWQLQTYTIPEPATTGGTTGGGSTTGGTVFWYPFPSGEVFTTSTDVIASTLISAGTYTQRYNLLSEQDISGEQAAQLLSNPLSTIFPADKFGTILGVTASSDRLRLIFTSGGTITSVQLSEEGSMKVEWPEGFSGGISAKAALEAFVLDHFILSTTPIQTNLQ